MIKTIATKDGSVHVEMTAEEVAARQAEEAAELNRRAVYAATEKYKDDRAAEYPKLGDQLDAIWKELQKQRTAGVVLDPNADALLNQVLAVKEKYPKP